MKKHVLFYVLMVALHISCTKDSNEEPEEPDQIVYKDVNPDLTFKTIRDFKNNQVSPCPPLLIPSDSTVSYELDLDEDSEVDYKMKVRHYTVNFPYGSATCMSNCYVFSYKQISILPISSTAFICSNEADYQSAMPSPRNFYESDEITKDDIWIQKESFGYNEGCGVYGPIFKNSFTTPYWGLNFNGKLGWIKVQRQWGFADSNGLKILEWGFNTTERKAIKAGQKSN